MAQTMPAAAPVLPKDVSAFMARRDLCDHFRGEEPYDAARAAEIARQALVHCAGTDAELDWLKKVHAGNAEVQEALSRYEYPIEESSSPSRADDLKPPAAAPGTVR
jgi:hypothetical protein